MMQISTKLILILSVTSILVGCGANQNSIDRNNFTPSEHTEGVIYGKDSISEVDAKMKIRMNLASVAAIFNNRNLSVVNGRVSLNNTTVEEEFGTCPNFKLNKQIAAAHCSGVLVGRQVVLTAKHCVTESLKCPDMSVVFGYDAVNTDNKTGKTSIPAKMVYRCKEVQLDKEKDAARIILDRPVSVSVPLVRRSPPTSDRKWLGKKVYAFGFSLGTPVKKSEGIIRFFDSKAGKTLTTLDVFDRNSGSPVFTEDAFFVGILSGGESDFVDNYDDPYACQQIKKCKDNECAGETVLNWWQLGVMSMPGGSGGW